MIEGVEILNQTMIMTYPKWFLPVLLVGAALIWLGLLYLCEYIFDAEFAGWFLGMVLSFVFIAVMRFTLCDLTPTGRYRYEATIDKSVSFTELYEKYDIVEQRGEIYILEDKENK